MGQTMMKKEVTLKKENPAGSTQNLWERLGTIAKNSPNDVKKEQMVYLLSYLQMC